MQEVEGQCRKREEKRWKDKDRARQRRMTDLEKRKKLRQVTYRGTISRIIFTFIIPRGFYYKKKWNNIATKKNEIIITTCVCHYIDVFVYNFGISDTCNYEKYLFKLANKEHKLCAALNNTGRLPTPFDGLTFLAPTQWRHNHKSVLSACAFCTSILCTRNLSLSFSCLAERYTPTSF